MALLSGKRKWQDPEQHGWIKRHSLSVVLITLMTVQTVHAVWSGHRAWVAEEQDWATLLKQPPAVGWPWEFWVWWSWEYQVSLVADTFGAILLVMLSKWLYEEGSAESN